jgi:HEAT repeat protein
MQLDGWKSVKYTQSFAHWWLRLFNLRPEESERTLLMFAFYTATSVGILWLEVSAAALFLGEYGANRLPFIYLASAGIGSMLGLLLDVLQRFLPLRRVIVVIAVFIAAPLLLFRIGLGNVALMGYTVFLMRLWLEAVFILNEVNTTITANQLFNIREIKRTYPLVSSGILVADVLSGLSLPLLRKLIGLENVILMACLLLLVGAGILFYLSQTYKQFFPDSPRRRLQENQPDFATRRLRGPLFRYAALVVAFFVMSQILLLLVDFQYLSQIEFRFLAGAPTEAIAAENLNRIADFLATFSAIVGMFELMTQWFFSSRIIERLGVFTAAMIPPAMTALVSMGLLTGLWSLFWGLIILKFLDELLRYTLVASTGPVMFQPIPENVRGRFQNMVRGVAEPLSIGFTGLGLWLTVHLLEVFHQQTWVLLLAIALSAMLWTWTVWMLRSGYLRLLVMSAEQGQLSRSDVDLRTFKRAIVEILDRPGTDADKASCIELLTNINPRNLGEILAPLLSKFSPRLQRQSLEAMTRYPNPAYLPWVYALLEEDSLQPEVLAIALRYIWITEPDPDIRQLRPYLHPDIDPVVRGTAASLMLRRGDPRQKAEATDILRRMLTHERERERVMGCRALGEAVYLQALRLYIKPLLQDESLRVRCALLEAIAATHLEEFYPSLLRGLHYKSTRDAAMQALVRLENEALPRLVELAEDPYKPEVVRNASWMTIGQIGTPEALEVLVSNLAIAWGNTRRSILRILLKLPQERGIDAVSNLQGRSGIEALISQELSFIGHLYAALMDLSQDQVQGREADLLRRSLRYDLGDAVERLFLLMRFLYSSSAIQAASFNLQGNSQEGVARGLEILDNTIDIPGKQAVLTLLDRRSDAEKLQSLADYLTYTPMPPSQRLRYLLDLRHFLSDWARACCFHLARNERWSLTPDQILASLRDPVGFVREAVISYLSVASPKAMLELLPMLERDPDRLVAAQVQQIVQHMRRQPDVQRPPRQNPTRQNSPRQNQNGALPRKRKPGLEPA